MSHPAQQNFVKSVKELFPKYFSNVRVLDAGSLDINGNNKFLFGGNYKYLGIDIGLGNNVDVVCRIHEFKDYHGFDTIISTECFEHDEYLQKSLINIVKLLRAGGLFLFTCATLDRQEHGTRRTDTYSSPFTSLLESDYYKNVMEDDIRKIINVDDVFSEHKFIVNKEARDLYFWGIKKL
jgi:SAM-dependent methyltransferase